MLRLVVGEPPWYNLAVRGALGIFFAALFISRIQFEYAALLLVFSGLVVLFDSWSRKQRSKIESLLVGSDFSLSLISKDGTEHAVQGPLRIWVTSRLIVLPVTLDGRIENPFIDLI